MAALKAKLGVIGVVGAGTMGAGIAQLALEAGHLVRIHDVDEAAMERGRARIRTGLERRAARLDLDPDSADAWVEGRLERLRDAPTLDDVSATAPDLVIEAALEDLEAKRAIFRALDGATAAPGTILATNTSALSVASIADATAHPSRVLGLHFFNPAPVMPLVEVVVTDRTDPAVVDRATSLMTAWGKVPVRCTDTPGFIVNRVNRPFTLEALAILSGGVTVDAIDGAVRGAGFPMGPFELMDLTGIDITLAASGGIFERSRAAGDPLAERFRPSTIQERLVAAGRLGRKTGAGFFDYGPDGRPIGPSEAFERGRSRGADMPLDQIVERITLAIVNEAYRALGDGVASAADIDLAMRLGAAHPSGPFERVIALGGPSAVLQALRAYEADGPRFDPAPALRSTATIGG